MKDTPNDIEDKEIEEVDEIGQTNETIPTIEKKWLRHNIFRSTGNVNGQACTVEAIVKISYLKLLLIA